MGRQTFLLIGYKLKIESRYPDEKRSSMKKCTEEFTKKEIEKAEEIFKWLKSIPQ